MIRFILLMLAVAAAPARPSAADTKWPLAAVGIIGGPKGGGCSATLIGPDLVLTAAHCLIGANADPAHLRFRTGSYPGVPATETPVETVAVHPLYEHEFDERYTSIRFDLAVARLATTVAATVEPLAVGVPGPEAGEFLILASYRGGQGVRARERQCEVFPAFPEVSTLACEVAGGESGSPLIRRGVNGLEVVGVLSSRSKVMAQPIGLALAAQPRLESVLDQLRMVESSP